MPKIVPTTQTVLLIEALQKKGVTIESEHYDGHKHVDIYISTAKIYIEVDGLQHYTNHNQIVADFDRNHYSDHDGFDTIHIPNELIEAHLEKIADAIASVVKGRERESEEKIQHAI